MLRYQDQDSRQTLREALAEYYDANVGIVTRPSDLPEESKALFRSHDICHVIFGLNTTLDDETLADTRTLFSCDVGVRRYLAYLSTDKQAKALFEELGLGRALRVTVKALPRIVRAAAAAFAMRKRWPWRPPESYMNRPIADLRREFGIRVL
jgi:ubiquinone biosynthesis protein Coq4